MSAPPVSVTVDLAILTVRSGELCVLLVRRGVPPFVGEWALPGGYVLPDEDLRAAADRELREETGLTDIHLEQLATYGAPDRDPRGRTVTVAHLALTPDAPTPAAGTDAAEARWWPVAAALGTGLAFDHDEILRDGVERARAKLEYSSLGAAFCPPEFTVSQLREVYEAVWGERLDPRNFHRKVTKTPGFLEETGSSSSAEPGRPAKLYRRGPTEQLTPPITR
ncbi:NUDIX hydrolase [Janibacter limosus]|uniref:NUDIX hydrolase n=1 Tax=Janibacter limosus TaxID=53458 RepID=UPI00082ADF74|nr:NUDIX domain-containing protein [Janibacter limosus]